MVDLTFLYSVCCSNIGVENNWVLFSWSFLRSFSPRSKKLRREFFWDLVFCKYDESQKYNFRIRDTAQDVTLSM